MNTKNNKYYMYVHAIIAFIFVVVSFFISMTISNERSSNTYMARSVFQYTVLFGIPLILAIVWTFKNLRVTNNGDEYGVIDLKYSIYILIWGLVSFLLTIIPTDNDSFIILKLICQNGILCSFSLFFTIPLAVFASALTYRHQACETDISDLVNKSSKILLVIAVFFLLIIWIGLMTNSISNNANALIIAYLFSGLIYILPIIIILSMIGKSYSSGAVSFENVKDEKTEPTNYLGIPKNIYTEISSGGIILWGILVSFAPNFIKESRRDIYHMWGAESILMPLLTIALPLAIIWYSLIPEKTNVKEGVTDTGSLGDIALTSEEDIANEQEHEDKYSFVDYLKKNVVIILIFSLVSLIVLSFLGPVVVFAVAFMIYKKKTKNMESNQEQ